MYQVKLPKKLYEMLAVEASNQGVSVEAYVAKKLWATSSTGIIHKKKD